MTIYDWFASLWRTVVPLAVGLASVQLLRLGIEIDNAGVSAVLVTGFGTVYYAVFRTLEQHAGKGWGWFLGLARPPQYPGAPAIALPASLLRSLVPYLAGFAGVQLARLGIDMDSATLTATLTAAAGSVYYGLFRALEQKAGTGWGWLLGLARPPQYPTPGTPAAHALL